MAKIIRQREHVEAWELNQSYDYVGSPGAGFSFPCDEQGNVDTSVMQPCGIENYQMCLKGEVRGRKVVKGEIIRFNRSYWQPAVIICDSCGKEHELYDAWCSTCDCGAEYNGGGQRLASREQWGEETGEHPADVARGPLEMADY